MNNNAVTGGTRNRLAEPCATCAWRHLRQARKMMIEQQRIARDNLKRENKLLHTLKRPHFITSMMHTACSSHHINTNNVRTASSTTSTVPHNRRTRRTGPYIYVYMHLYLYIIWYIYIYIYILTYLLHVYIYIYIERERDNTCVHIYICVYIYIYIFVFIYSMPRHGTGRASSMDAIVIWTRDRSYH